MPQAASLADAIKSEFGIEPELIKAAGGKFEVTADGQLIFSKLQAGRFPEPSEIIEKLRALSTT